MKGGIPHCSTHQQRVVKFLVEIRMYSVLGDFTGSKEYEIFLHVYENGFPGTTAGQQLTYIRAKSGGMYMQ